MLHMLHLLHLLHSGFLICRGLKLFLLAVTVTLLSALGVWQSQLFTFHRPLVRCHFYPTIHSEKSVVLRGASTPFVSKSRCSPPGSWPEATWCWIDFEIAVSCFFKKTPWGTKFPLNLTFSSFSPHRNYLTVKLRSINDHWGIERKKCRASSTEFLRYYGSDPRATRFFRAWIMHFGKTCSKRSLFSEFASIAKSRMHHSRYSQLSQHQSSP